MPCVLPTETVWRRTSRSPAASRTSASFAAIACVRSAARSSAMSAGYSNFTESSPLSKRGTKSDLTLGPKNMKPATVNAEKTMIDVFGNRRTAPSDVA